MKICDSLFNQLTIIWLNHTSSLIIAFRTLSSHSTLYTRFTFSSAIALCLSSLTLVLIFCFRNPSSCCRVILWVLLHMCERRRQVYFTLRLFSTRGFICILEFLTSDEIQSPRLVWVLLRNLRSVAGSLNLFETQRCPNLICQPWLQFAFIILEPPLAVVWPPRS